MNTPRVFAITVNWNRPADTLECLGSLARQTYPNLQLVVVDNASSDGSPEVIQHNFPQARLLVNTKNLKFAGGYNHGIRHALQSGAEHVFIINNDATLDPDGLVRLMAFTAPEIGILAPLIYYADPPNRVWSAGGRVSTWNLEKRDEYYNRLDPASWPTVIDRDFVTGCAMLFSRSMLETVGLFDEHFELYYEDSDLCFRTRQAQLGIRVVPAARAWHKVSASSGGSSSPDERYWMARSSIRFFRKHARGIQWPVIGAWRLGSALRTSLRLLGQGRGAALQAYWRGLRDGWADRP